MQVPQCGRGVDIASRACIDFEQQPMQRVQAHACAREIKSD
jgi:hypothetical protein